MYCCIYVWTIAIQLSIDISLGYKSASIQKSDVEQDHLSTIERMFRKLQEEEIVGININSYQLEKVPVHVGNVPEEFKSDPNIVKCLNYPNSNDQKCSHF